MGPRAGLAGTGGSGDTPVGAAWRQRAGLKDLWPGPPPPRGQVGLVLTGPNSCREPRV